MAITTRGAFAWISLLVYASGTGSAEVWASDLRTAEQKEESCWKLRYGHCDGIERSDDLVLVFPSDQFKRSPALVVKKLQSSWDLLREMTGIDPRKHFGQRVVIGYRHRSDEGGQDCLPGWIAQSGWTYGFSGEIWPCINVPWYYLKARDEPEECLTVELVHPFLAAKRPLHGGMWDEAICEFLSLPLCDAAGLTKVRDHRYRLYRRSAWRSETWIFQDYTGRLIRWCERNNLNLRKPDQLKVAVRQLWDMDFEAVLGKPLPKVRRGSPR